MKLLRKFPGPKLTILGPKLDPKSSKLEIGTLRSRDVNGTDENPTGPAIHQGQVTDTSLIWGRVFGNESQQSPRVYPPTGKVAKNPVGPHYESKVFFDKSLRSPDLLHAKDVKKFDLFMQIFKFFAKEGLIPAKE